VADADGVSVGVFFGDGTSVGLNVVVALNVAVALRVGVALGAAVAVSRAVGVADATCVAVGVGEGVERALVLSPQPAAAPTTSQASAVAARRTLPRAWPQPRPHASCE